MRDPELLKSTLRFPPDRDGRNHDRPETDPAVAGRRGAYLDSLALSQAVIGEDIVLEESPGRRFVLHQVVDCRAHRIGDFHGAADAWEAIDAVDGAHTARCPAP